MFSRRIRVCHNRWKCHLMHISALKTSVWSSCTQAVHTVKKNCDVVRNISRVKNSILPINTISLILKYFFQVITLYQFLIWNKNSGLPYRIRFIYIYHLLGCWYIDENNSQFLSRMISFGLDFLHLSIIYIFNCICVILYFGLIGTDAFNITHQSMIYFGHQTLKCWITENCELFIIL